jgi:hypothetical protein
MMHPEADGQLTGAAVTALPATLKNIVSVIPSAENSVIGEQPTLAVVSAGPATAGGLTAPPLIVISHTALSPPLVPQTNKSPVPFPLEK